MAYIKKPRHNKAKKVDFPIMFYREVPAEKILKKPSERPYIHIAPPPADLRKRQILMWSGVIGLMAFLILLWGLQVKENLKNAGPAKEDFNFLNKGELSDILNKENEKRAETKKLEEAIKKAAAAPPISPIAAETLTGEQINELKKKIENK